ncbi:hypothetical protein GQ457_04G039490 [Hibiscus cannabinus]
MDDSVTLQQEILSLRTTINCFESRLDGGICKAAAREGFRKSIDFPMAISQSSKESDEFSLVTDFAKPKNVLNSSSDALEVGSGDIQQFDEMLVTTAEVIDGEGITSEHGEVMVSEMISVDSDDKTQVIDGFLSELSHNKFLIFKGCGKLTMGLMEPSPNQGLLLDSLVVAGEVDSGTTQVFDGRFVRKRKNSVADKLICELVESDDPYGFRLLLMAKYLQDGVREAISIQALDQRTKIQLGLAIESQKAILSLKRRLTCELLIYYSQFVEAKVVAYYLTSLVDFFDDYKLLLMEKKLLIREKVSMGEDEIKPNRTVEGLICLMQKFKRIDDFIVDTLKLRIYIGSYLCETLKLNVVVTRKRCWRFDMGDFQIGNKTTRCGASGCSAIVDSGTSMWVGLTSIFTQINHAIGESEVVRQEFGASMTTWGKEMVNASTTMEAGQQRLTLQEPATIIREKRIIT